MTTGTERRLLREAKATIYRAALYKDTPPPRWTRQMRRQAARIAAKHDRHERKRTAMKAKGGSAVVR